MRAQLNELKPFMPVLDAMKKDSGLIQHVRGYFEDGGAVPGNVKEQLNLDAADVMIPKERPDLISSLCILSKKTRNIIIQNLILSITLTTLLVFSVIFAGNDKLWLNVLAHELSAIMVILNAMKLGINPIIDDQKSESKNRIFNPFSIIINLFKELYHES